MIKIAANNGKIKVNSDELLGIINQADLPTLDQLQNEAMSVSRQLGTTFNDIFYLINEKRNNLTNGNSMNNNKGKTLTMMGPPGTPKRVSHSSIDNSIVGDSRGLVAAKIILFCSIISTALLYALLFVFQ